MNYKAAKKGYLLPPRVYFRSLIFSFPQHLWKKNPKGYQWHTIYLYFLNLEKKMEKIITCDGSFGKIWSRGCFAQSFSCSLLSNFFQLNICNYDYTKIQKNKENEDLVQINREKLWEKSIYRSPTQWCMARIHHIL